MYVNLFSKKIGDYYFVFEKIDSENNAQGYSIRCMNHPLYKPFFMLPDDKGTWHINDHDKVHQELLNLEKKFSDAITEQLGSSAF